MWGNLQNMMDHNRTRAEVERRKAELLGRQEQIPQEIRKLSDEMEFNKRQLIGIEQILEGLSFMDSDTPYVPESFGLTDSVRQILSDTTVPLVPTQIRDALEAKGIMGSTSKNLLINVHKVVERIEDELIKSTRDGKTAYKRKEAWSPYVTSFTSLAALAGLAVDVIPRIAKPNLTQSEGVNTPLPSPSNATPTRRTLRPMRRGLYARRPQRPASEPGGKNE